MKKILIQISHTEYGEVEIEAKNEQEAENIVDKKLDHAIWGNDETDIIDVKEIDNKRSK